MDFLVVHPKVATWVKYILASFFGFGSGIDCGVSTGFGPFIWAPCFGLIFGSILCFLQPIIGGLAGLISGLLANMFFKGKFSRIVGASIGGLLTGWFIIPWPAGQ